MDTYPVIVWIRRDLRIADNPALYHAAQFAAPIIPVFIWTPEEDSPWAMGGAQQWWLHHSLHAFRESLQKEHLPLIVKQGSSAQELLTLARKTGARRVLFNLAYEPAEKKRDRQVSQILQKSGIEVIQYESHLLHNPSMIQTGKGDPYKVYTPFWKKIRANLEVLPPLPWPKFSDASRLPLEVNSLDISSLSLLPKIDWAAGMREAWTPGEKTALDRLSQFSSSSVTEYATNRDFPLVDGTSKMSPHLHFGEISPRVIWKKITHNPKQSDHHQTYLKQLIWREFSYHLLYHFPETANSNLRKSFDRFPWSSDSVMLERWQKGETGYPIVDAGMRQLWATGWMHNRVRMIVASFLTKHLLIHWIEGARWFWDTLVDANLANNTMGWQWSAGSGADAQPFFRIFNPITQSKKFDAEGSYIKRWIPELKLVSHTKIHEPWLLSITEQNQANIRIGSTYPLPVVAHKEARERALTAYKNVSM